jgi:hypothetical protein
MAITYEGKLRSPSIIPTDQPVRGLPDTTAQTGNELRRPTVQMRVQTGSEFAAVVRSVLGKDAGQQLHLLTGYPERSCYRYAAGDRPPPVDFMARLFGTEQGECFFDLFMGTNRSKWWTARERARCIGEAALRAAEPT